MPNPSIAKSIEIELVNLANPHQAKILLRFFKTKPGEYGAGDCFLGIKVPVTRSIVKKYQKEATIEDAEELLQSKWHECRLAGALLLEFFYRTGTSEDKRLVYELYLKQPGLNNWDLIDVTVSHIVGTHLLHRSIVPLKKLARSKNIWKRRIAIVSTFAMIRDQNLKPTFEITAILMHDQHDLIHKACGWMLREAGKRDKKQLERFLVHHLDTMPRTMLRYAIEKFPEKERRGYLKKKTGRRSQSVGRGD